MSTGNEIQFDVIACGQTLKFQCQEENLKVLKKWSSSIISNNFIKISNGFDLCGIYKFFQYIANPSCQISKENENTFLQLAKQAGAESLIFSNNVGLYFRYCVDEWIKNPNDQSQAENRIAEHYSELLDYEYYDFWKRVAIKRHIRILNQAVILCSESNKEFPYSPFVDLFISLLDQYDIPNVQLLLLNLRIEKFPIECLIKLKNCSNFDDHYLNFDKGKLLNAYIEIDQLKKEKSELEAKIKNLEENHIRLVMEIKNHMNLLNGIISCPKLPDQDFYGILYYAKKNHLFEFKFPVQAFSDSMKIENLIDYSNQQPYSSQKLEKNDSDKNWFECHFPLSQVQITSYVMKMPPGTVRPKDWKIQGTNDPDRRNWDNIDEQKDQNIPEKQIVHFNLPSIPRFYHTIRFSQLDSTLPNGDNPYTIRLLRFELFGNITINNNLDK